MHNDPKIQSVILASASVACALLLATACATDDPIREGNKQWKSDSTIFAEPNYALTTEPSEVETNSSTELNFGEPYDPYPNVTQTPSSTTKTVSNLEIVAETFTWYERSERVRQLQTVIGVEPDGVYGSNTRSAHLVILEDLGMGDDNVPERSTTSGATFTRDNVPGPLLARVRNLWPESEWDRALLVAWCESGYRVDAANPTSSARGIFQLLAPWRRDPGSGRTVWGWEYTESGEKLSAAAGLGISEANATWTWDNVDVAFAIWQASGWGPWEASRHCWGWR